jgi:hypothetical protein
MARSQHEPRTWAAPLLTADSQSPLLQHLRPLADLLVADAG